MTFFACRGSHSNQYINQILSKYHFVFVQSDIQMYVHKYRHLQTYGCSQLLLHFSLVSGATRSGTGHPNNTKNCHVDFVMLQNNVNLTEQKGSKEQEMLILSGGTWHQKPWLDPDLGLWFYGNTLVEVRKG